MFVYYGLLIFTLFLAFQEVFSFDHLQHKYWVYVLFFGIWIIVGGRVGGIDASGYESYFKNAPMFLEYFQSWNSFISFFDSYVEFGFLLLSSIVKLFTQEYFIFLLIFVAIIFLFRYKAYQRTTPYVIIAMLLYMSAGFIRDMSQIRNALSSVLVLNAAISYSDGRNKTGIVYTLLASLMHTFSIITIILPFFLKFDKKIVISFLVASLMLSAFLPLGKLAARILQGVPIPKINAKVTGYLSKPQYTTSSSSLFSLGMIRTYLIIIFLSIFYDRFSVRYFYFENLYKMLLLGYILAILTRDFTIISDRIRDLFGGAEPILLSLSMGILKEKEKILGLLIIALYSSVLFISNINVLPEYKYFIFAYF